MIQRNQIEVSRKAFQSPQQFLGILFPVYRPTVDLDTVTVAALSGFPIEPLKVNVQIHTKRRQLLGQLFIAATRKELNGLIGVLFLHINQIFKVKGNEIPERVYMGDIPIMTDSGTFIINGAERVIVSQLVRSPGIYYEQKYDKVGKKLINSTVIPNRGAWLEYESDLNDVFGVRIDKNRKLPITTFIRALGLGSDAQILDYFGEEPMLLATLEKDSTKSREEALLEVYRKLRPGEPPTIETSEQHLHNLFFDARRYDLAPVGRYKFDKKVALHARIRNHVLAQTVAEKLGLKINLDELNETNKIIDSIHDAYGDLIHAKEDNGISTESWVKDRILSQSAYSGLDEEDQIKVIEAVTESIETNNNENLEQID